VLPGDPFTPMIRSFAGDPVRVKMQAGGHEEEHNATIHGLKWLQAGSGHGKAPNSGWRNAQAGGISEQFTLTTPLVPMEGNTLRPQIDYAYSMDAGNDGWWSGMWGIMRAYERDRADLFKLPTTLVPSTLTAASAAAFNGVCPVGAPQRNFDITAVMANDVLPTNPNVTIQDLAPLGHVGPAPAGNGRTLVYNHRTTTIGGQTVPDPAEPGQTIALPWLPAPIAAVLWMVAVLTMTLGNVGALLQRNVKRMLAYSSIAQSGYLIIGLLSGPADGFNAVLFYLLGYGVTNTAMFAVLASLERNGEDVETLDDLAGLRLRHPVLAWMLAASAISLIGMPPLVGFFGKLALFSSAFEAGQSTLVIVASPCSPLRVTMYPLAIST